MLSQKHFKPTPDLFSPNLPHNYNTRDMISLPKILCLKEWIEGIPLSKGGELEMSLTQLNLGSRSEMVKIQNAPMSVAVHSDGLRMHS